jgi:general secretion pathway protein F
MPEYRYRALTEAGKVVSGSISASSAAEVARQIDYLRLVPIDEIVEQHTGPGARIGFHVGRRARADDVTIFTLDLALLLKAGARLDDALELLAGDMDIGKLRATVAAIRASILAGESFAEALAHHPQLFPAMYIALVRVGEATGTLETMLQMLARERMRAEALQRKVADALRYPSFVLLAAVGVLIFFLMFVLPQFSAVLRDFGAELDPIARIFVHISDALVAHQEVIGVLAIIALLGLMVGLKHPTVRAGLIPRVARLPVVRTVAGFHRTALFFRNLDILLAAAVPLTTTLRILADMMANFGHAAIWSRVVDRVRHGGKLADALQETEALPAMAVRMLRLGEESGQLALVAGRVAEFYETKLERSLDRVVALVGPVAIITISVIVGGLIVSVMSSLLSVSQLVG